MRGIGIFLAARCRNRRLGRGASAPVSAASSRLVCKACWRRNKLRGKFFRYH